MKKIKIWILTEEYPRDRETIIVNVTASEEEAKKWEEKHGYNWATEYEVEIDE